MGLAKFWSILQVNKELPYFGTRASALPDNVAPVLPLGHFHVDSHADEFLMPNDFCTSFSICMLLLLLLKDIQILNYINNLSCLKINLMDFYNILRTGI